MGYYYDPAETILLLITSFLPAILAWGFGIVTYIFGSIGLYKISSQRGYKNAWLAWIPVANSYVLGGVVDNINYCYNRKSNFRITLMVINLLVFVPSILLVFPLIGLFVDLIMYDSLSYNSFGGAIGLILLMSFLLIILSITYTIISYICHYKMFVDYSPSNAALYLVLSILFQITPFFVFAIRNKPSASLYYASQVSSNNYQQPPTNGGGQYGQYYQTQQNANYTYQQNQTQQYKAAPQYPTQPQYPTAPTNTTPQYPTAPTNTNTAPQYPTAPTMPTVNPTQSAYSATPTQYPASASDPVVDSFSRQPSPDQPDNNNSNDQQQPM